MRILVAEDDLDNARLLENILRKNEHTVEVVPDGAKALERLRDEKFDALLTDWMMPEMDGITLIQRVRAEVESAPLILMITAISDDDARQQVLEAGADDFLIKPYRSTDVVRVLSDGLARLNQPPPETDDRIVTPVRVNGLPPFVSVVVAAGTGGPSDIHQFFKSIDGSCTAAFFVVQHGPDWMMNLLARQIRQEAGFPCTVAYQDLQPTRGNIYLVPGDYHLGFSPPPVSLELNQEPKENYLRPSADYLFRNAATVFGEFCVAVILSGVGRDGSQGVKNIKASGGAVFVEDPKAAAAPSMPQSALDSKVADAILPLNMLGEVVMDQAHHLNEELMRRKKEE
jgi:two-component system, chemotaxis family, protein-glutamate methylesterase/glutaminase